MIFGVKIYMALALCCKRLGQSFFVSGKKWLEAKQIQRLGLVPKSQSKVLFEKWLGCLNSVSDIISNFELFLYCTGALPSAVMALSLCETVISSNMKHDLFVAKDQAKYNSVSG